MLHGKRILLIVAGGIAAFKSAELIRLLRGRGASVRCVLTEAGAKFVTPLTLQALSEDRVYGDMFSLTDESEMGHIQLSRDADLLLVAPATANMLARMAGGLADEVSLSVRPHQGGLVLRVLDRGPGMSESVLANALLPFYSTKSEGTGLGLTLCREIVEAHEGRLVLANREGGGLEARIVLP